jgi:hypothetical protein
MLKAKAVSFLTESFEHYRDTTAIAFSKEIPFSWLRVIAS